MLETTDTWYMDDSNLVLNMCQDSKAEADDQGPVLTECYACDEAKYEVTFEGLWSRNTHPKVCERISSEVLSSMTRDRIMALKLLEYRRL